MKKKTPLVTVCFSLSPSFVCYMSCVCVAKDVFFGAAAAVCVPILSLLSSSGGPPRSNITGGGTFIRRRPQGIYRGEKKRYYTHDLLQSCRIIFSAWGLFWPAAAAAASPLDTSIEKEKTGTEPNKYVASSLPLLDVWWPLCVDKVLRIKDGL